MGPRVSVVIPTYNNADFVEATLASVLGQTFRDLEVCVSDHASTDGTWEILTRIAEGDSRVRLARISAGGGAQRNWNHATGMATGDFVKLVCADDLLKASCIEQQVTALEAAGPSAVMAASKRDVVDDVGRTLARARGLARLCGRVAGARVVRAVVRAGTNVLGEPACVMFRAEALRRAGGWHGRDGYVIDLRTYLRVLEAGDLVAVPESLAAFRVSADQWSVRLQHEQVRQVTALLEETATRWPGTLTRRDLAWGRAMVRLNAGRRRFVYRLLSRRTEASVTGVTEEA